MPGGLERNEGAESLPTLTFGLGTPIITSPDFQVDVYILNRDRDPFKHVPYENFQLAMVGNSFRINACTAILRPLQVVFMFWSPSCVSWKLRIQFLTPRLHVCITTEWWHNFTRSMINCLVQLTSWQCWHRQFFTWRALEITVLHWFNDITALYPQRPSPRTRYNTAILINIKHDRGWGIVSSRKSLPTRVVIVRRMWPETWIPLVVAL